MEGVMHGLYLLWWVGERGLSPTVVAAIIVAGDLALFVLEVPTGVIADRWGHRASLIAGSLLQVCGMLACWFGRGVPELVAASLLVALGDAFRSGADEALLYRTCIALDRERDFLPIAAKTRSAGLIALVGLTLGGGLIVKRWGFGVGWLLETVLCATGAVMAWAMVDPPQTREPEIVQRETQNGERSGTPCVQPALRLLSLVLPVAAIGAVASAATFLSQVSGTVDPGRATVIVAAVTLTEAAGAWCAARCPALGWRAQWIMLAAAAILVAGIGWLPFAITGVAVALSFLTGLAEPLRAGLLQRTSRDDLRARTASFASACDMALAALTLSLAGAWRGRR